MIFFDIQLLRIAFNSDTICFRKWNRRKCVMSSGSKKNSAIYIRVSEDDLERVKQAAKIKRYASYTEYIRRTVLLDADATVAAEEKEGGKEEENT